MNAREQVKHMLISADITMTELCKRISQKLGKEYSMQNLSAKLKRNTIKYIEMQTIFDILGYDLIVKKKIH